MNAPTLRRLAADHAELHNIELPPNYLFAATDSESNTSDDLTQLNILLTGPQGTPYSQGLWKLWLKIPEDYPKNPPKAAFRTRIWHPNVEENTGSVCVDTLKKDWAPRLTLRHVLVTISCLLIYPNPDSALNAAAGHLLQDDYEQFARQARLMTSIHAKIPTHLREATTEAKRRGEDQMTVLREDAKQPSFKGKSKSASSVIMKKLPPKLADVQIPASSSPFAIQPDQPYDEHDEALASKENDPALSPTPVKAQSPRRQAPAKCPLSDLPVPSAADIKTKDLSYMSTSLQNMANNESPAIIKAGSDGLWGSQLVEGSEVVNCTGRGLRGIPGGLMAPEEGPSMRDGGRPAKRICSDEAKENVVAVAGEDTAAAPANVMSAPTLFSAEVKKILPAGSSGQAGAKGRKPRTGLRRL